jgi:hypothetical protein
MPWRKAVVTSKNEAQCIKDLAPHNPGVLFAGISLLLPYLNVPVWQVFVKIEPLLVAVTPDAGYLVTCVPYLFLTYLLTYVLAYLLTCLRLT